jgi:mono/diheme cytochrome c family protein
MRFRVLILTGVVASLAHASVGQQAKSAPASSAKPAASAKTASQKRPLTSQENLPWPAAVQEKQPMYPPALSAADELKTFHMPPGYRVELVASEPLVTDPILAEFDGDGRLWVLEMEGFAIGEKMTNSFEPVNDLVILEDTNHDGVYDKRTVFMDHLIMPRAFKILDHNCALIGEPPHLWKACDTDGDLKADTKELVNDTFATQGVIEHGANGLYWGMDNTIYVAEHTWNVQFKEGKFNITPTLNRGQWGITQDDAGRIYRNVNTDALFTDYIPSKYFVRNPDVTRTEGLYEPLIKQEDTFVWPIRPTLGVNRGYRKEVPRPDGSAYYYQGVSSPLIYRGDKLPKNLYGQAFVLDGPTNLMHLLSLKDDGTGKLAAADFYKKGEFLASTDERFRPVSLTPGWDGSFYIVDMYRGVSQDEPIQTDYLRNYIGEHRLWEGIHYGRIYRVVHDTTTSDKKPAMIEETPAQLVTHLSHPNGWWRDTAQQLLVQRNDKSVVPALKQLAMTSPDFRARLQAMWTLDGMNAIDAETVTKALGDKSPEVRASAVRLSEHWLGEPGNPIKAVVLAKMDDSNWQVRRQLAASLGELPQGERVAPVVAMLKKYGSDQITVDAAVSSLPGQEIEALQQLAAQSGPSEDAVTMLAGAVGKGRNVAAVQTMLTLALDSKEPEPIRLAILTGAGTGLEGGDTRRGGQTVAGGRAGGGIPGGGGRRRAVTAGFELPAEPTALIATAGGNGSLAAPAKLVVSRVTWPGKPVPQNTAPARTPAEEALFNTGQGIYQSTCVGCHQAQGQGMAHIAAPLAGSKYVTGNGEILTRILTNGKEGSIGTMPPLGEGLTDDQLAGVMTYIRASFGNMALPIHPAEANEWRQANAYHKNPWTEKELDAGPKRAGGPPQ